MFFFFFCRNSATLVYGLCLVVQLNDIHYKSYDIVGICEMAAASSCTLLVCVRKISDRHAEKLKPQGIPAQAASGEKGQW